jgi:hypothetical protein
MRKNTGIKLYCLPKILLPELFGKCFGGDYFVHLFSFQLLKLQRLTKNVSKFLET